MGEATNEYFKSYENLEIHKLMLEDSARNEAYRQAIFDNKDHIKGKVVLDVGCGTGILSLYFAQAGASKVYGVEASNVAKVAQEVIKENNYENVVQIMHSTVEDVILPEKVDIIVSEWMGFYLLHEAMLSSVIYARNKFLKPDGLMFPESATLFSAPCSIPTYFEKWDNVNGISMKHFGNGLRKEVSKKPLTITIKEEDILSIPEVVLWIDLREVTLEDVQSIQMKNLLVANKQGKYQGICLWFSCQFPSFDREPVILSTGPEDPETHWKQTVIVLPHEEEIDVGAPVSYELSMKASNCSRFYSLDRKSVV